MGILVLIGFVFIVALAVVVIGLGIAAGLIAGALGVLLSGLWLIASSIGIALWTRRVEMGVRAFLLQACVFASVPLGAAAAWLLFWIFSSSPHAWLVLFAGGAAGAMAGLSFALVLDFILRRISKEARMHWRNWRLEGTGPRWLKKPIMTFHA